MASCIVVGAVVAEEIHVSSPKTLRLGPQYQAKGIKLGIFKAFPELRQSLGYNDNPIELDEDPEGDFFSQTDASLRLESNWKRHWLDVELSHGRRDFFKLTTENKENWLIDASGEIDVSRSTRLTGDVSYELRLGTLDRFAGAGDDTMRERREKITAATGVEQDFGRLQLSIKGTVFDKDYRDISDNGAMIEDDRSYTEYGLRLRSSYKANKNLSIFLEGAYNERRYRRDVDDDGVLRGSIGFGIFAGVESKLTGKVSANAAIGYRLQDPDDPFFSDIEVLVVDGWIQWRPNSRTAVTVFAETFIDETTTDAAAAVLGRFFELELQHILRENLSVTARASYGVDDYIESDNGRKEEIFQTSIRLNYALNPIVMYSLRYTREQLFSNIPDQDLIANIVRFGVRIRR